MFSPDLFDKEQSSTISAVCFNENMFANFETNVLSVKVKKTFGNATIPELLHVLDSDTKVSSAALQLKVTDHTFTSPKYQVRSETMNMINLINLTAKVTNIGDAT